MAKKIKSEIKPETKTEIKTKTKIETKIEAEVKTEIKPKIEIKPKTENKSKKDSKVKISEDNIEKVEPKVENKIETESNPEAIFTFSNSGTACVGVMNSDKIPMNSKVVELLTEISEKLNKLISSICDKKPEKVEHIELNELQLSELKFLKELANDTIILNKYPGGNQELVRTSVNLVNKIDTEIMNRLKRVI